MASEKPRILVVEGSPALSTALRKHLETAALQVSQAESLDSALQRLRRSPPHVLIAGTTELDVGQLCRESREISPLTPIVLVYPPEDDDPDQHAAAAGADAYLVGPIKRGNVLGCVRAMLRLRALAEQIAHLEAELDRRVHAPSPERSHDLQQVDFDFFKRLLLMELRRSRRYKYPLAFLLVAIDRYRDVTFGMEGHAQAKFVGQLLAVAVKAIRDVDMCVLYAEDKFLVFAPHTPLDGALRIGRRLKERLGGSHTEGPRITVSVGVAAYDGKGGPVSFGGLIRDAAAAVKTAQAEGGNRVEFADKQRSRERISLT